MNKIFKNISMGSDINELVDFLDKYHPNILQESIQSNQKENSFFIHFSSGIINDYEKIKYFYEINKKYNYNLKNSLNNKNETIYDLEKIAKNNSFNEDFFLEIFSELSREEKINFAQKNFAENISFKDYKSLVHICFKNKKTKVIEELGKYEELWGNEFELKLIKSQYLNSLKITNLFSKYTKEDSIEEARNKCLNFVKKNIMNVTQNTANYNKEIIVKFLEDMFQSKEIFTQDFIEKLIGVTLGTEHNKILNSVVKLLTNNSFNQYNPEKPLWTNFEHLKNKDVLNQFLSNIKVDDYWEDKEGNKHYQIDYLDKALNNMDVNIKISGMYLTGNKAARDTRISKLVVPILQEYATTKIEGVWGYTREFLKESSFLKKSIIVEVPKKDSEIRIFLDNTLFYKKDNQNVLLNDFSHNINMIKNIEDIFNSDILTDNELTQFVENFPKFNLYTETLQALNKAIIDRKITIEPDTLEAMKKRKNKTNEILFDTLDKTWFNKQLSDKLTGITGKPLKKNKI